MFEKALAVSGVFVEQMAEAMRERITDRVNGMI